MEVALLLSIVMVALVMLVFLRRVRPTVIAMFSVPLSLAGAFVLMYALGFTLNMMSLIALVLCIGFVVDDAIVVIENIFRHMEQGADALEASLIGVKRNRLYRDLDYAFADRCIRADGVQATTRW